MNKQTITVGGICLILGLAGGYFGAQASQPQHSSAQGQFAGRGGGFGARGGAGGFLSGTVAVKDASSITLDTRDGSSHVILLTPTTGVSKSVAGQLADVAVGAQVLVSGTPNPDGSISATLIQLRPASSSPMMGR